jgi:hypothetical protein
MVKAHVSFFIEGEIAEAIEIIAKAQNKTTGELMREYLRAGAYPAMTALGWERRDYDNAVWIRDDDHA